MLTVLLIVCWHLTTNIWGLCKWRLGKSPRKLLGLQIDNALDKGYLTSAPLKKQNLSGFFSMPFQGFLVKHSCPWKHLLCDFYVWTMWPSLFFFLAYSHFFKPDSMRISMHNRHSASLNLHQQWSCLKIFQWNWLDKYWFAKTQAFCGSTSVLMDCLLRQVF